MARKPRTHREAAERRKREKSQPPPESKLWGITKRWWKRLAWCAGFLAAIIGFYGDLLPFAPRVSIKAGNTLDPQRPFSTLFEVSNDGIFTIYNVHCGCTPDKDNMLRIGNVILGDIPIEHERDVAAQIKPATTHSFTCPIGVPPKVLPDSNTIHVTVSYNLGFLPIEKKVDVKFVTRKDSNGQLIWIPRA